ncbi:MAG: hypothetical protein QF464_02040, partial [Myxococcota bacterium]|nr:hypothetical protein [Myxococcota bacterium]
MAMSRESGAAPSGLARLLPSDRRAALALLRQARPRNAYLLAQIARGALGRDDLAGPLLGHWTDGVLDGVAVFGSNLVLSTPCSDAACEGFARYARAKGFRVWVAIGEDALIERFMATYGRTHRRIALERTGQRLYAMTHRPIAPDNDHGLRPADVREAVALMRLDGAMVTEELGFDPFARDPEAYRRGWLRRIREDRSWVVERAGELVPVALDHIVQVGRATPDKGLTVVTNDLVGRV